MTEPKRQTFCVKTPNVTDTIEVIADDMECQGGCLIFKVCNYELACAEIIRVYNQGAWVRAWRVPDGVSR